MTHFLRMMSWTGLLAAALAAMGFAYVFLSPYYGLFGAYGPGHGSHVHGWELLGGLFYYGIPGAALYCLGLIGSWALHFRQDPSFLRLYGKFSLGLLLFAMLVLGADYALLKIVDLIDARQQQVAANAKADLDDPAKFAAYIDSLPDVDGLLPQTSDTLLEAAVMRGYQDLVKKLVAKGASVSERSLDLAVRMGDAGTAAYLWEHGKGLTGLNELKDAFVFGQIDVLRALVSKGVKADPLLRWLCVVEFHHYSREGQADWENSYSSDKKGKSLPQQMFRFLAQSAADKSGEGARGTLMIAVYARNVETLRMLLESGFDLHALDGRLHQSFLLTRDPEVVKIIESQGDDVRVFDVNLPESSLPGNKEKERLMKSYLLQQGLRWRPSP